ncbi:GNAT family N-acetyltransferase [Candidatus Woesearchaeota archaeon]|nr:GNAT family N-acetyltransferase [Candidatus Woesearchaeota archaeon]
MSTDYKFNIRFATQDDCEILYSWRIDPDVRKVSKDSSEFTYDSHKAWFTKALMNANIKIFIVELDNIPAGQVRFNIQNDSAVISVSLSKDYRGKGLGSKVIQLASNKFCSEFNINKIIAYIRQDNISSRKSFEKAGYTLLNDKDIFCEYIYMNNEIRN